MSLFFVAADDCSQFCEFFGAANVNSFLSLNQMKIMLLSNYFEQLSPQMQYASVSSLASVSLNTSNQDRGDCANCCADRWIWGWSYWLNISLTNVITFFSVRARLAVGAFDQCNFWILIFRKLLYRHVSDVVGFVMTALLQILQSPEKFWIWCILWLENRIKTV